MNICTVLELDIDKIGDYTREDIKQKIQKNSSRVSS